MLSCQISQACRGGVRIELSVSVDVIPWNARSHLPGPSYSKKGGQAVSSMPPSGSAGPPANSVLVKSALRLLHVADRVSLPLLRASLGVVFIWFGALKLSDATPVGDLVANTLPFLPH